MNVAVRSRDRARLSAGRISTELDTARNVLGEFEAAILAFVPDGVEASGLTGARALIAAPGLCRCRPRQDRTCEAELTEIATTAAGWNLRVAWGHGRGWPGGG